MDFYQHDSAARFRFVLHGELCGASVEDLEHAWATAASAMRDKELVVDLRGLTEADPAGTALLARMRDSGARFISAPARRPEGGQGARRWRDRLLAALRLSSQRA